MRDITALNFAAFTAVTLLSSATFAATQVGVVGAANPTVTVRAEDGSTREIKSGDKIYLNDTILTNGQGSAQIMFEDKSALTVSPNSEVVIDTFVYNPESKNGTMTLSSAKGALRFIGGALTKQKPVKITTPVSTIGIRGGIADTFVDAGGKTDAIFVFGKELTMQGNDGGAPVSVTAFGQGLGVNAGGGAPIALPPAVLQNRMSNSPTRAATNAALPSSGTNTIEQKMEQKGSAADRTAGGTASKSSDGASNSGTKPGTTSQSSTTSTSSDGTSSSTSSANATLSNDKPVVTVDVESGGTAQEDVRSGVKNFVEKGGDANNDGKLDFQIATPGDRNSGNVINDFINFINGADKDLVKNSNTTTVNVTTPVTPVTPVTPSQPGGNQTPPAGGNNGGTTNPPAGGNTTPPPGTSNPPTAPIVDNNPPTPNPPPPTPTPPTAKPTVVADIFSIPENDTQSYNLLSNDTGNTLLISEVTVDSTQYTMYETLDGGGSTIYSIQEESGGSGVMVDQNGHVTTWLSGDLAPGEQRHISFSYTVSDENGQTASNTAEITYVGTDFFGNQTAWDTNGPAVLPWHTTANGGQGLPVTHRGQFFLQDTDGGTPTKERAKITATIDPSTSNFHFLMESKEKDGTAVSPSSENYVIGSLINQGSATNNLSAGYNPLISSNNVFETSEGIEDTTVGFKGVSLSTAHNAFNYYAMQWDADQDAGNPDDIFYINGYLGTSLVQHGFNGTLDNTTVRANLEYMYFDTKALAANQPINSGMPTQRLINYSFLPDLHGHLDSGGDPEFGIYNYNSWNSSGWLTNSPSDGYLAGAANSNRMGLLVDWGYKRYITSFVDFMGNTYGNATDPTPTMIAAFGNVKPSGSVNPIDNDERIGGDVLNGKFYQWNMSDRDESNGIHSNEISKVKGTSASHLDELFSNPHAINEDESPADNPINALILQTQTTNGAHGSQAAVADTRANNLSPQQNIGTTVSDYHGFTGGVIGNSSTTSIVTGEMDILVTPTRMGSASINAYSGAYQVKNYNGSALTFGGSAEKAALQKDYYAYEDTAQKGVLIAPGGNTNTTICSSCDYTHWGVWATDVQVNGSNMKTAMVPYVVGILTDNDDTDVSSKLNTMTTDVTFSGGILANATDGSNNLKNVSGSFDANVNLANREMKSFIGVVDHGFGTGDGTVAFGFNGSADAYTGTTTGQTINGIQEASGPIDMTAATGQYLTFSNSVGGIDSNGDAVAADATGQVSGALFGMDSTNPAADIGGNLEVHDITNDVRVGGVFLGNR